VNGARRGFTLIELMVVVALVATVMALVGPSVRELLATQRVRGISAELMTDLQYARSEAVRRNRPLLVQFSSDDTMDCYVIYTEAAIGRCSCLRPPGLACTGGFEEVKTVQLPKSLNIAMAASSAADRIVSFEPLAGDSRPGAFSIDLTSSVRGALRTSVNATGRPAVCSPDGSIKQVPRCPGP
jgi:type IV fimbrial biogenesis protein FimT